MNRLLRSATVVLLFAAFLSARAQGDSQRPDYPRALLFFHHFRDALRQNDRKQIASLIKYPLLVQLHGKNVRIRSKAQLLAHFDGVFDSGVKCEVMSATDKEVWGNSHGFTVSSGAIWFDDFSPPGTNDDVHAPDFWTKGTFRVMTVNNGSNYPCKR